MRAGMENDGVAGDDVVAGIDDVLGDLRVIADDSADVGIHIASLALKPWLAYSTRAVVARRTPKENADRARARGFRKEGK